MIVLTRGTETHHIPTVGDGYDHLTIMVVKLLNLEDDRVDEILKDAKVEVSDTLGVAVWPTKSAGTD